MIQMLGANEDRTFDIVEAYDIESNTWSRGADMIYARHGIFPIVYQNAVYIAAGGVQAGFSASSHFTKYCLGGIVGDNEQEGSEDGIDWRLVIAIAGPIIAFVLIFLPI